MSGFRLTLLTAMAMVFVGAFASVPASATSSVFSVCLKSTGGSGTKYEESNCAKTDAGGAWESVEVKEALTISGTSGVTKLKSSILKAEILITCKKSKVTGEIEPAGVSQGEAKFEECEVGNSKETFKNCTVPNFKFSFVGQLIENATTKEVEDEFKPKAGSETLVEIKINSVEGKSCSEKGTFPVKGTQDAELPEQATHKTSRTVAFKPSGSHLSLNGEEATLEDTASVVLSNGDSWGV